MCFVGSSTTPDSSLITSSPSRHLDSDIGKLIESQVDLHKVSPEDKYRILLTEPNLLVLIVGFNQCGSSNTLDYIIVNMWMVYFAVLVYFLHQKK